jgi:hypothetical protein
VWEERVRKANAMLKRLQDRVRAWYGPNVYNYDVEESNEIFPQALDVMWSVCRTLMSRTNANLEEIFQLAQYDDAKCMQVLVCSSWIPA